MLKSIFDKSIKSLEEIAKSWEHGDSIYLVGGCVRDLILGLTPKDIDLCIDLENGTDKFIEYLKNNYSNICHGFTVYPKYGTAKFILNLDKEGLRSVDIECVIPRIEKYEDGPRKPSTVEQTTITEDALRRDFCCNALYKNLLSDEILDPTSKGIDDCKNKILRTPLDPKQTYIDDPLRMLRAIRFSCTKGFRIETDTFNGIDYYPEYDDISMERIRDEFDKILMSSDPLRGINMLIDTGLMYKILPELIEHWDFDQLSKYHSMSWLDHTLSVLSLVIRQEGNLETRLAALLHDVSKPIEHEEKPDGTLTYHGHEKASEKLARIRLTKLKYPGKVIDKVCFLIGNHMCIKQLYNYEKKIYTGKPKKTRQLIKELGDNLEDLMILIEADNNSHAPEWNMPGQVESFLEAVKVESVKIKNNYGQLSIKGEVIMSSLGIGPGKAIKEIKEVLQQYLYESPGACNEELLDKYKNFYNKDIYINKCEDAIYIYANNPDKDNKEIPLRVTDYWRVDELQEGINKVSCVSFPELKRQKDKWDFLCKKMDNICNELDDLQKNYEFSSISINFDGQDFYSKTTWKDGSESEIL